MSDDPELDELVRASRRGAARRLLAAGMLVSVGGLGVLATGLWLNHQQADSAVHFTLPDRLELAGGILLVIGLLLAGAITRMRR